jgi:carboxyl-terminal processing protease
VFQTRRFARALALGAVVLAAYGGGVLTGVLGTGPSAASGSGAGHPASSAPPGLLDQAASTIQQNAANPISRAELDKAAVEGMLQALDDKWSSYFTPGDFASFESVMDG